ncbi:MAG: hypothetical protein KGL39_56285, partial [Patescibacteria group bacterium]|nr:hypothetical protein [Patescibacteria group bacterium]
MNKHPPPNGKKKGRVQVKYLNSPQTVVPVKPRQHTGATKTTKPSARKQKQHRLAKKNLRLWKDFWWVIYHDLLFIGNGALGITIKHSDEI